MTRFDSQKRNTLKIFAGTGTAIATASIGVSAFAGERSDNNVTTDKYHHSRNLSDLEITIIKSAPLGQIKIVVRNHSDQEFHIKKFTGEKIALDGHHKFHLSRLLTHGPISIKPFQSKHFSVLTIAMEPFPQQKHVWETKTTRIPGKIKSVVKLHGSVSNNETVFIPVSPYQRPAIT